MNNQQVYAVFAILAIWCLAWSIIGMIGGDRYNKGGVGLLIGLLLGPLCLFLYAIPTAKDLKMQIGKSQGVSRE